MKDALDDAVLPLMQSHNLTILQWMGNDFNDEHIRLHTMLPILWGDDLTLNH